MKENMHDNSMRQTVHNFISALGTAAIQVAPIFFHTVFFPKKKESSIEKLLSQYRCQTGPEKDQRRNRLSKVLEDNMAIRDWVWILGMIGGTSSLFVKRPSMINHNNYEYLGPGLYNIPMYHMPLDKELLYALDFHLYLLLFCVGAITGAYCGAVCILAWRIMRYN